MLFGVVVLPEAPEKHMSPPETVTRVEWVREAMGRHEAALLRYAQSLTGDPDLARDVVQDTFLKLCEQEPEELSDRLAPWLFTVCRNRVLDVVRKERRMSPLTEVDLETRESAGPNPAAAAATSDATTTVLALMDELPVNQREVVRLKFQGQMSYEEISAVTELSVGNVGFLLHTAIRTLRARMEALERPGGRGLRSRTV
jgi:RNA polymerase sigma-70 factor (ECF subfamily)